MKPETLLTIAIVGAAAVAAFFVLRGTSGGASIATTKNDYNGQNDNDAMWGAILGLGQVAGQAYATNQAAETAQSWIDYQSYSASMSGGY